MPSVLLRRGNRFLLTRPKSNFRRRTTCPGNALQPVGFPGCNGYGISADLSDLARLKVNLVQPTDLVLILLGLGQAFCRITSSSAFKFIVGVVVLLEQVKHAYMLG